MHGLQIQTGWLYDYVYKRAGFHPDILAGGERAK